jgi:hypothetical protein
MVNMINTDLLSLESDYDFFASRSAVGKPLAADG